MGVMELQEARSANILLKAPTKTGRENMVIRYCPACGYREPAIPGATPPAAATRHGGCRSSSLRWVSYEVGVEEDAAEAVIASAIERRQLHA